MDIGGVLLTNGWDRLARAAAAERFELDPVEFEDRHELGAAPFEAGALDLEGYLEHTDFYRPRPFSREQLTQFMFAQSRPHPEASSSRSA